MESETTGKKIKAAREKAGLTQAQLAKAVGTTAQNISQYERCIRKPKYGTLQKIASALGTDWYSLLVPDTEEELNEARSIKFYMVENENIEEAQKEYRALKEQEQVYDEMIENLDLLNEAGLIAAAQLVFSTIAKESIIDNNPHRWIKDIFNMCVWHGNCVEETASAIKEFVKIPAFRKEYFDSTSSSDLKPSATDKK